MATSPSQRVIVLYNTDYDAELLAAADVSAVRESAQAICTALATYGAGRGLSCQLMGVHGADLGEVLHALTAHPPDLVFNLCESLGGDARHEIVMPAVLDMLGLRYTGSNALTLGMCLHKERTKDVLAARGIPTPRHCVVRSAHELEAAPLADIGAPCFLKLAHEDASVGIDERNLAQDRAAVMARARELLAHYRQPVLIERYIDGRELNVTVLGSGTDITVLPVHEIDFAAMPAERPRIVSYAAKWDASHVDYAGTKPVLARDLDPAVRRAVTDTAVAAYRALEVRDIGRVDLRLDAAGIPWVIDINPNCDLSPDAGAARAAARGGMSYDQLIGRICEIAWSRYENPAAGLQ